MATFVVVDEIKANVGTAKINFGSDVFKLFLTNSTPTKAGTAIKGDLTPISSAGGYAEITPTCAWAETAGGSGIWRFSIGADKTWTASGAAFDTFRYVVIYDDTQTSPVDPVVGYWDAGTQNIADGSSFTLNVDADFAVFEMN